MTSRDIAELVVSIRAPAWGATPATRKALQWWAVSIRAPAWGATQIAPHLILSAQFQFALPRGERLARYRPRWVVWGFNSRSRVGSD